MRQQRRGTGAGPATDHDMGYSAKAIANFFIDRYGRNGITPLKLQKLIYLAHGWHLALYDDPLVDDEYAEAWQYGPVFPSIYHEFKEFGRGPISRSATDVDFKDNQFVSTTPRIDKRDRETTRLLERIWEIHGKHSGLHLSALTHQEDSPWDITVKNMDGTFKRNEHISDMTIKDYYRGKLRASPK